MRKINYSYQNMAGVIAIYAVPADWFVKPIESYRQYSAWSAIFDEDGTIAIPVYQGDRFAFVENQSLEEGGMLFNTQISGIIPMQSIDPLSESYIDELMRGEWIVITQDANGDTLLCGTTDVPMIFTANNTTGSSSELNGRSFTFTSKNAAPSIKLLPLT